MQFYPNFALFSTLGGMNLDHNFFQVRKLSEEQKRRSSPKILHFFPKNQVETCAQTHTRVKVLEGMQMKTTLKLLEGIYPPIPLPPGFGTPVENNGFYTNESNKNSDNESNSTTTSTRTTTTILKSSTILTKTIPLTKTTKSTPTKTIFSTRMTRTNSTRTTILTTKTTSSRTTILTSTTSSTRATTTAIIANNETMISTVTTNNNEENLNMDFEIAIFSLIAEFLLLLIVAFITTTLFYKLYDFLSSFRRNVHM